MRKRNIARILAFLLLLSVLVGCAEQASTQASTADTTAPTETEPSKGSNLVEYDPDRQIYFLSKNRYHIYFQGVSGIPMFTFEFFSKEKLDLDTITVSVPSANVYTVEIYESDIPHATEFMSKEHNTMPLRVYEAYYGVDYCDYGSDAFKQQAAAAKEAFQNLTEDEIPTVHRYSVLVLFEANVPRVDEEITYVDVTIDGTHYQPTIGCFKLVSKENSPYTLDMVLDGFSGRVFHDQLYNDGLYKFSLAYNFEAKEDMTITGIEFLGDEWEMLSLGVWGTVGGMSVNFSWDGKSPIDLYEGDKIDISGVLHNPHLDGITYDIGLYIVVNAEVDDEAKYFYSTHRIATRINPYELHAIIFDGIDMEPYYRGYYYQQTTELWRKPYLEQLSK